MISNARYGHTNLIARDWRRLAKFYEEVFGCVVMKDERHYTAAELEAGTGVPGAGLWGVHLRLPGVGPEGPTLEIFTYSVTEDRARPVPNRQGWGHIAFAVPDVATGREEVLASGGSAVGEIVTLEPAPGKRVRWCYVTDPEANIIELQSWETQPG